MHFFEALIFVLSLALLAVGAAVTAVCYATPNKVPKRRKLKGEDTFYNPQKGDIYSFLHQI
jgi:hypothetical protein